MSELKEKVGFDPSEFGDDEIIQAIGETKNLQIKGTVYKVGASSLCDLPKLNQNVAKLESMTKGKDDMELMKDGKAIDLMKEIMFQGTKDHNPGITKEHVDKHFTLSAFPVIFRIMLDLNEYLSSMQKLKSDSDQVAGVKKN